jgi:hypothetical protein
MKLTWHPIVFAKLAWLIARVLFLSPVLAWTVYKTRRL